MTKRSLFVGLIAAAVTLLVCPAPMLALPTQRLSPISDLSVRQQRVEALSQLAQQRKADAVEFAKASDFPVRWEMNGTVFELMKIDSDRVWIYMTHNANAAISAAVTPIRQTAPYFLDGTGQLIGVWDSGAVRQGHQEFTGRVVLKESVSTNFHATHVAGTLIASGAVASAKGMSPAATVDSYEFNNDLAEMTGRAMSRPGEAGTIQISNHSYGFVTGWDYHTSPPRWYGIWGNLESDTFGQYDSNARDWDQLCYDAPYYLPFKSAGNDRSDSAPSPGTSFEYYTFPSWKTATYDPAIHPKADNWDQGGYDTISAIEVAKNIMTVGAVNDAVLSGQRNLNYATMTSFSCWGPADDGRIKPDIVANGAGLYSCIDSSDTSYASYSGTSMSSPNACGAAGLLLHQHANLFSGQFMKASTLKGLIIHTADDLGNPGPDYRFGFGLMNTQAAADLIFDAAAFPGKNILIEDALTSSQTHHSYQITYDGTGPVKATLCWTDPPGTAQSGLDNPTIVLVNDLDLRIIAPNGTTIYYPYILSPSDPAATATTGDNIRDTVEQVEIDVPPVTGLYTVEVTYKGTLTNGIQDFSLIINGNSLSAAPPTANNVNETTFLDASVNVTLDATDDSLPTPPGALSYIITSLPNHGLIADSADPGTPIVSVPYMLSANDVIYTPRPGCDAPVSFAYIANDGGTAPDGGDSNEATVQIDIVTLSLIYSANMDTDPAWTLDGLWAWGVPAGSGGARGNPDPAFGYTGEHAVGYNLKGDYPTSLSSTEYAATPAIDCSGVVGTTLSFYRWLNVDSYNNDKAVIDISTDGVNWTRLWQNNSKVTDSSWIWQTFDLSSIADNQPRVYLRWGMGPTNNNQNYSGWNIDDVQLTGFVPLAPPLTGDLEPDCDVDAADLTRLLSYWLASCGDCDGADLVADGIVNLADLQALAANWLAGV